MDTTEGLDAALQRTGTDAPWNLSPPCHHGLPLEPRGLPSPQTNAHQPATCLGPANAWPTAEQQQLKEHRRAAPPSKPSPRSGPKPHAPSLLKPWSPSSHY